MTVGQVSDLFTKFFGRELEFIEKEALFESFRVKMGVDEQEDIVNDREVTMQALVNSRKQLRQKKIN